MQTESQKRYYQRNKKKIIARIRSWQKANPARTKSKRKHSSTPHLTFSFYRDFFKPFASLPTDTIEGLIIQFQQLSLPANEFITLSLMLNHSYSQATMARMLKVSQGYISRVINKQLFNKLAPIICKHKTTDKELLDLIIKVNLNVQ
jgi:hypothetical protein